MTPPADTPIQPIQQARLEMALNELRHYWSEETIQAAAPLIEDLDLEIKSVTYIKPNEDIPLKERLCRADKLSCQIGHPIQETIIISIHVDGITPRPSPAADDRNPDEPPPLHPSAAPQKEDKAHTYWR